LVLVRVLVAAGLLPLFLGPQRERLLDFSRRRRAWTARFLFEFLDALQGGPQLPLQAVDDVEEAIHADPSLTHVPLELLNRIHARSLANRPARSCASFQEFQNW